jgi:hypothetical protein
MLLAQNIDIGKAFKLGGTRSITGVPAYQSLGGFISAVLPTVFVLSGIILFVLIVFGGLMMVINAGSGDAKKAEQGKNALTAALLGMVVIFVGYWLIVIIEFITGVRILTLEVSSF